MAGHTAVVVNGATGLGVEIARALASHGAELVLMDTDPEVGAVASRLRSDVGMPAMGARGDATDDFFVQTAFRAAIEHLDFPDFVIFVGDEDPEVVLGAFAERLTVAGKRGTAVIVGPDHKGPTRDDVMAIWTVNAEGPDVISEVLRCCLPSARDLPEA